MNSPIENPITRRRFLRTSLVSSLLPLMARAQEKKPRRILLRSAWQTVNIGDIGHTPGVLRLLEEYLPETEIRLWPSSVNNGVEEMLRARFPKVAIVKGADAIKTAFAECDFLLHGSGPSLVAEKDVIQWHKETDKPYGVYGITLPAYPPGIEPSITAAGARSTIEALSNARFAFFRDSESLEVAKKLGVKSPVMEFGPDGAFAVDLRNDAAAESFLKANGLEPGGFLCCIPRLRFTPYWDIHPERPKNEKRHARNEEMKERDHLPLRDAIIAVTRETPLKVLLCPEDQSQMAVGKEMLLDKLPDDVRKKVVWRERYWLTDEAVSTYVRSAGLFGHEMHSPIMCVGNGVPAIVCRWAEQTSKGIMWRDIGLGDWLFNMDNAGDVARIVPTVLALAKDPAAAKAKADKAREVVRQRQSETMTTLKRELEA